MKKRILTFLVTVAMMLSLAIVASAAVSFNSVVANQGETITITVSVSDIGEVTSLALTPEFDSTILEFVSDAWLVNGDLKGLYDGTTAVIGFNAPTALSGNIYEMTFKVKEDADFGEYGFAFGMVIKNSTTNASTTIPAPENGGTVTVVCAHENLTYVPGEAATCIAEGVVEHYICSDCDTIFADAACTTEIEETVLPIDENNHENCEIRDAVEATDKTPGYTGDTWCLDCGKKIATGREIPVVASHKHTYGKEWKYNTFLHWKECTECKGMFFVAGHKMEWVVDKAATETSTGLKHKECTECGYSTNLKTVIPMIKTEETTAAPETTAPVETTAPAETTAPVETTKPVETTTGKPADTSDSANNKSAQTGDINVVAISVVAAIAVLGLGIATIAKKKFNA